jgi:hypothetical protein
MRSRPPLRFSRHPAAPARATGSFQVAMASAATGGTRAGLPLSGLRHAWEAAPNPEFRARIARAERSRARGDGYGQRNGVSGALGRYNFLPSTLLRDLGWQAAGGGWTETPNAALSSRERRAFQVVKRGLQEFEGVPYGNLRQPVGSSALVALRLQAS